MKIIQRVNKLNKHHKTKNESLAGFMEKAFNKANPTYKNHRKIFFFGDRQHCHTRAYQFNFVMPCYYIELFFARLKKKYFSIAFAMVKYFIEDIVKNKRYNTVLQS
ncbi:MAG: hypothetical protein L3J23_07390 [Flavobacteriaceae bacterium]|nr:hypothetical protein [Flavobacteriaceae bacterium]